MIQGALMSRPVVNRHGVFFWCLRTLVKVRYSFPLVSLLMAMGRRSLPEQLVWVGVSFLAVLLHELGHALAAQHYRQRPQIELHALGGVTSWAPTGVLRWSEHVVISLAGPGSGLLIGGLLLLADLVAPQERPWLLELARRDFLWATLAWGLFNLLPMLPLDGGQALGELLERRLGAERGRRAIRLTSCVTGFAGLVAGMLTGQTFVGVICAVFAFDNLQRMRGLPGVQLPR